MNLIISKSTDPCYNLALEERLFQSLPKGEHLLYMWVNRKTVVIGRNQIAYLEVDPDALREHEVKLVRRLSGGGAVYHDEGNLNYTLIGPAEGETFDFRHFSEPVVSVLRKLGIPAVYGGRNDLLIEGAKFCGNAQYMEKGKMLHHGCILLTADPEMMRIVLRMRKDGVRLSNAAVPSRPSGITWINRHLEEPLNMEEFRSLLVKEVTGGETAEPYILSGEDERAIQELILLRYGNREWNWGRMADYDFSCERCFSGGLLRVEYNAKAGRIEEIRISGDFFGREDIRAFEKHLIGLSLEGNLPELLRERGCSDYLNRISAEEFASLLKGT